MKRIFLAFSLILLVLGFAAGKYYLKRQKVTAVPPPKYNVLVVSVCSLRAKNLGVYGYTRPTTPHLDKFAKNAFVFREAYTDRSWSNLVGHLSNITDDYLNRNGYQAAGAPWQPGFGENSGIMEGLSTHLAQFYYQLPNVLRSERDSHFVEDLDNVKARILNAKGKPFFLEVHSKFMHLPYSPPKVENNEEAFARAKALETKFLSEDQLRERSRLVAHPRKYIDRVSAILMMGQEKSVREDLIKEPRIKAAMEHGEFAIRNSPGTWINWIEDPLYFGNWKKSGHYESDLELIRNLYDSRLAFHDEMLSALLNLYGQKELQDNTVVIFLGDHGEEFGEHGSVTHGNQVYDESLHFPMLVKFPKQSTRVDVANQVFQGAVGDLVKGLIEGKVSQENFLPYLYAARDNDWIVARNCQESKVAVRWKNQWKLIVDVLSESKSLFDLSKDPGETRNVAGDYPNIVAQMEEYLWKVQFDTKSQGSKMIQSCEP